MDLYNGAKYLSAGLRSPSGHCQPRVNIQHYDGNIIVVLLTDIVDCRAKPNLHCTSVTIAVITACTAVEYVQHFAFRQLLSLYINTSLLSHDF